MTMAMAMQASLLAANSTAVYNPSEASFKLVACHCSSPKFPARRCISVQFSSLEKDKISQPIDAHLYSFTPFPLLFLAALPGAGAVRSAFGPFVELVKSWNLPDWLVHWGHPGNMAVVLFAMGGYGTYLGFRIRFSDDIKEKAKAKDLHPKLLGGMFFFFALGATGGITSLLTSDKPILESYREMLATLYYASFHSTISLHIKDFSIRLVRCKWIEQAGSLIQAQHIETARFWWLSLVLRFGACSGPILSTLK